MTKDLELHKSLWKHRNFLWKAYLGDLLSVTKNIFEDSTDIHKENCIIRHMKKETYIRMSSFESVIKRFSYGNLLISKTKYVQA